KAGVPIEFSEPMDPVSVAASLTVEPAVAVHLEWAADHRSVVVRPVDHWGAGSYQVITVQAGALAASGRPLSSATRAAFVTRGATNGRVEATGLSKGRATAATALRLSFDHAVPTAELDTAFHVSPALAGTLQPLSGRSQWEAPTAETFVFVPSEPMAAGVTYKVSIQGLVDVDGAPVTTADASI